MTLGNYRKEKSELIARLSRWRDEALNKGEKALHDYYCNQLKGIYLMSVIAEKRLVTMLG